MADCMGFLLFAFIDALRLPRAVIKMCLILCLVYRSLMILLVLLYTYTDGYGYGWSASYETTMTMGMKVPEPLWLWVPPMHPGEHIIEANFIHLVLLLKAWYNIFINTHGYFAFLRGHYALAVC